MYVDTDFILALLKQEDWLQEPSEQIYKNHKEELWSSKYILIELLILSYREDWNPVNIVAGATELIDIRDETQDIKMAAIFMEEKGYTPFDALHLVSSGEDSIISSDKSYDKHSESSN